MAAVDAGAPEAGVARLRGAVASARRHDDPELLARSLVGLGQALVHSARGTDEEGAAALHEGSELAEQHRRAPPRGDGLARDRRGFSSSAAATTAPKRPWPAQRQLADGDEEELAWIEVILGTCRSDVGDYASAAELLRSRSPLGARRSTAPEPRVRGSMLAKLHVLRGELDEARRPARRERSSSSRPEG